MDPKFPQIDKAAMTKQLQDESADYVASQPKERNQGYLSSGVNRLVRGSQNIVSSGPLKDPYKI
jgi:hypothetical protein